MTKPHFHRAADGATYRLVDGYRNLVSNLNTARDKAYHGTYWVRVLTYQELLNAYRSSWLPRKIVDIPALDATRKWRAWQADADQITELEAEEKRHGVREKVRYATTAARLWGGAVIYIGTGDADPSEELRPDRIKKGGLKNVTVMTPFQISAGEIERDPESPYFGRPARYTMNTGGDMRSVEVHPSRVVHLTGAQLPDPWLTATGWGDSVLQATYDAFQSADSSVANVASLIFEAKVDVLHIPGLMAMVDSEAGEAQITQRLLLGSKAKGVNGMFVLDGGGKDGEGKEEYQQKSASFNGLPDVLMTLFQTVSGAADIPMTRLFGRSAAGMNATGEGDERNYYDRVQAMQELEMQPAMAMLDEVLIRSALGARPAELHYTWSPLRQITERERADNADKLMSAIDKLARLTSIPEEAIGKAAVNALTESGAFPGLESAVERFGGVTEPDDDDLENATLPPPGENEGVADAAPRTLYVRRDVKNADEIIAWAKDQGFATTIPTDDMHVTIAFSRTAVDWMEVGDAWSEEIEIPAGGARLMERFGGARVLLFSSSELSWRHEEIKRAGASWDHPEFQPHITISYAEDAPDLAEVKPYTGRIVLGPEIFEEVNPKWMEGVREQ